MISTLGGLLNLNLLDQSSRANDVIVIRHKDGSLHSTPFNVRFGRRKMWNNAGRVVQIEVNGELTSAVMKIGKGGETYWLQPTYCTFGHSTHHRHEGTEKALANTTLESNPAIFNNSNPNSNTVALLADNAANARGDVARFKNSPRGVSNDYCESTTLSVSTADLQQYSIFPESPLELAVGEPSLRGDDRVHTAPKSSQDLKSSAAMPSSNPTTEKTAPKATRQDLPQGEQTPTNPDELLASAGSSDSTTDLPLLHRDDDGYLMVETRAIHSAKDVQEARLALQAMAAAEKSRQRLSKLLLKEDAFFLQVAEEEGQLDIRAASASASADAMVDNVKPQTEKGQTVLKGDHTQTWDAETLDTAETAVAAAAAKEKTSAPPMAASPSLPAPLSPPHENPSASAAAAIDDAADVSSVGSGSGSSDSYKVEDTGNYFLDTIDAAEYAAMYGEELLENVSFSSSVTSGVSITDAAMGGSDSDVSKTLPTKPAAGDITHAAAAVQTSTTATTAAVKTAWFPAEHNNPSNLGKVVGKAGDAPVSTATALLAASTGALTNSTKLNTTKTDMADMLDAEGEVAHLSSGTATTGGPYFTRTLIPVEADLWKLHLRDGCNAVRYLARKDKGEIVSISCNIFLWNWTDRLVVSDVDGTITKSDLWGHFYAMLGKGGDWTHPGICNLYSKIALNGYRMVYLTARSVSQINQTKSYLFTLQQDGVGLPLGPVLTAPQRFFTALTQEVSKQSHVFKIACLTSVRAAFPAHTKPFFAGFGNRYNDVISYDAVSIPTHKIFIIDPSSVLHVCLVKQTYRDLGHLVDVTFPPLKHTPVVLRAPPHLRPPHEHNNNAPHKAHGSIAVTGITTGEVSNDARRGAERHAYARDLLHRSSSASSSSYVSSSGSDMLSNSCSSDLLEHGCASSGRSMEDPSAMSASAVSQQVSVARQTDGTQKGCPQQHHYQRQQNHIHHRGIAADESTHTRHTQAAFRLADSSWVATNSEGHGEGAADASAAVSPSNTAITVDQCRQRGQTRSSVIEHRGAAGALTLPSYGKAGTTAVPPTSNTELTGPLMSESSVYSSIACPASPYEMKSANTNAVAATSTGRETNVGVDAVQFTATAKSGDVASASPNANTKITSNVSLASANLASTQSGSSSYHQLKRPIDPKYNYGQRGVRVAGADGVYGAGLEDYEGEEELPVDPDFSSFAYWRVDPRDLIAPSTQALAKLSTKTSDKTASNRKEEGVGTESVSTTAGGTDMTKQPTRRADQNASHDKQISTTQPTEKSIGGIAVTSPFTASNDTSQPANSKGQEYASSSSSQNAVDALKPGAKVSQSFLTSTRCTDSATGAGKNQSPSRDRGAVVKNSDEGRLSSSPPLSTPVSVKNSVSLSKSDAPTKGTTTRTDARHSNPLLTPSERPAAQTNATGAEQKNTATSTSTSARRGFFSAFTFGRGQPTPMTPDSPNTVKAKQVQEEARRKALAHPDAWVYYHAQQQQTPSSGGSVSPEGTASSAK